jgi:type I restriction enzyme S subunit
MNNSSALTSIAFSNKHNAVYNLVKLNDVASSEKNAIVDGPFGSSLKTSDYVVDGIPVLQGKNITGNKFKFTDIRFISIQKSKELIRSKVVVGDILIIKIGSIGYAAEIDDLGGYPYAIIPANLAKISIDKNKIIKNYLLQWLKTDAVKKYFENVASKTAQPALSLGKIKDLPIPLPPLAEQQRIAELLDTADRILKQRESAIAKLDQLAQSVFVGMLKDAKNCMTIKKLGEICDVRDGTHDSPKYVNEGVPLITSKNLTNGFIDLSNVNLISNSDLFEINKRSKVDYDDILMPMIGTIGNPVIVKDPNPKFAIKNVALIKQIAGSPNSIYLKAVLESASFKSYIEKISRGGTQKFLGLGDIRKFEFAVMDKKNEDKFVNFTKKLNSMRDLYLTNALKQKEMLASLQHQSFAVN